MSILFEAKKEEEFDYPREVKEKYRIRPSPFRPKAKLPWDIYPTFAASQLTYRESAGDITVTDESIGDAYARYKRNKRPYLYTGIFGAYFLFAMKQFCVGHFPSGIILHQAIPFSWKKQFMSKAPILSCGVIIWWYMRESYRKYLPDFSDPDEV